MQWVGPYTFHRLGEGQTRVLLQLDVDPEGLIETAGDKLGFVERRARRGRSAQQLAQLGR